MDQLRIEVNAGPRCRDHTVVRIPLNGSIPEDASDLVVTSEDDLGICVPAQADKEEGELVFVLPRLAAGWSGNMLIKQTEGCCCGAAKAVEKDNYVEIHLNDRLFTEYHFPGDGVLKPYLAPVIGPYGDEVTRPIDPSITEHSHHKGVFIAHGSVCGEEIWNEPNGECGSCEQKGVSVYDGGVFVKVLALLTWKDRNGKPLMDETRSYWIYSMPEEARVIDLKLQLKAAYGEVELGQTKEAGFLGIRVHPDMNGNAGKGGVMENAYGAVSEAECWSKKAHWCDYHGIVNGNRVGIAAFDNPQNLRFPTRWHIRDYGLFAANQWFWDGPYTIPAGGELAFRHRIVVHAGSTAASRIAERYLDYDMPVEAKFPEEG